jgi:uncharacterized protein
MPLVVRCTDDPAAARRAGEAFLVSRPIEHNVILTILRRRIADPMPGRYCWVEDQNAVVGLALWSPLSFHSAITPMAALVVEALVEVMSGQMPELPGVAGEAASAASFAGSWAERRRTPATPVEGMRIYRLDTFRPPDGAPGRWRRATDADRDTLAAHRVGFHYDTGEPGEVDPAAAVERSLRAGRFFVWDDSGVVASAIVTEPESGVVRLGAVYTPPEHRRRGYATACVAATSAWVREHDRADCILYTQLANPTSNAIYRSIGYAPICEVLRYRFG